MENATKAIIIAASIMITMAIVSIAVIVFNGAGKLVDFQMVKMEEFAKLIEESDYTKFDNTISKGSQITTFIDVLKSSGSKKVGVSVKTNSGSTKWYVYDASDVNNLVEADPYNEFESDANNKINKSGTFKGEVVKNDNDEIVAVTFEQQSK